MKNKRIVIGNTEYSILLYILLVETWENDIFLLGDTLRKDFIKRIKKEVKDVIIVNPSSLRRGFLKYYIQIFKVYMYIKKISKKSNIQIYGNDNLGFSRFRKSGYIIIEDGLINYQKKGSVLGVEFIKAILRFQNPFYKGCGYSKYVKKIYLTGLAEIPNEIKNKVEIVEIKKLWNLKKQEEKYRILKLFNCSIDLLEKLSDRKIILYTQPLSEDSILSEDEKVELYSRIIRNYQEENIVIKKHPREKTDYKKYFKKVKVFEEIFPAEFLELYEIRFDKSVTIFSSAVLSCKSKKIDFYGTEVHPKLLERFGSMDHIIKRNCYL